MAFCKYCGTQLEEGMECTCERAVAARVAATQTGVTLQKTEPEQAGVPMQQASPTQAGASMQQTSSAQAGTNEAVQQAKDMAQEAGKGILSIWKNPADSSASYAQNGNFVIALIFMAVQALLSGILGLVQLGKMGDVVAAIINPVNSMASMFGSDESVKVELPYAQTFFGILFASLVISALFVGLLWAGARIMKCNMDIKTSVRIASLRSVAAVPFTLVAVVFTFINQGMALGINLIAVIFSYTFLLCGMKAVEGLDDNKRVHVTTIVNVIACLIVSIVAYSILKDAMTSAMSGLVSSSLF